MQVLVDRKGSHIWKSPHVGKSGTIDITISRGDTVFYNLDIEAGTELYEDGDGDEEGKAKSISFAESTVMSVVVILAALLVLSTM